MSRITNQHPPGTQLWIKRERLLRETANHRAIIYGIPGVHLNWYRPKRLHAGRQQTATYLGRDTVVALYHALRTSPPNYDMRITERVYRKVMELRNELMPDTWSDEEINEPVEKSTNIQSDSALQHLAKAQHNLRLAVPAALDFNKSFAEALHAMHNALEIQMRTLRPGIADQSLPPLDEMIDLSYIHETPPDVPEKPKAVPFNLTEKQKAERRAERDLDWKAGKFRELEVSFKLDKPIEELNPNYKRTTQNDDE